MSFDNFAAWLELQTGVKVIYANQPGADRPPKPYITMKMKVASREGQEEVNTPGNDGITVINQGQLLNFSFQSYGEGPLDSLQEIINGTNKFTQRLDLRETTGLIPVQVLMGPEDVPELVGTTWESRGTLDMQFRNLVSITDDVGIIEKVRFTGEANGLTVDRTVDGGAA